MPQIVSALPPAPREIITATMAGTTTAVADTLLGGPLEAAATFMATAQGEYANASIIKDLKQTRNTKEMFERFYQGAGAATLKGSVQFSTIFLAAPQVKKQVRTVFHFDDNQVAPWYLRFLGALGTGATVTAFTSPFDIFKTLYQMPNPTQKSFFHQLFENLKHHGPCALTAGLGTKAAMIAMGWAINDLILYLLDLHPHNTKPKEQPISKP